MSTTAVRRLKREVVPSVAAEFPFDAGDVRRVSERLGEPDWLAARRMQAWQAYRALPMPTLKDEPWRRTDIRRLPSQAVTLGPAQAIPVEPALLEPLTGDRHGALVVSRPGHAARVQGIADLPEGVIFADWAAAVREHADVLERHLGRAVAADEGKFAALAAALASDGALVYVPRGVQLEQPLHSVLWAPGGGLAFFSRVLVVLEEGASATFIHEVASPDVAEGQAVHAGIVEALLADGAQFTFVELQNLGRHVWNFTHERARIERDARLEWIFGAVGSRLTKNFTELDLAGQGAEARISGFYFADDAQHLDHDTQQNHLAPHTTSDLLYKGALVGRSNSVWRGMIYVAPGAQKTDGYQANRNLLLSDGARADSIPGLEILADDVRCSHGATVGRLEEEPLFYLMSRGLPRKDAERLLVDGFFAQVMERIPFERVRARLAGMIDGKLG